MKTKTSYILGAVFAVVSAVFTALVMTVDVGISQLVPETNIGFSCINNAFHNLTGTNMIWYKITGVMGIAALGVALLFAAYGGIVLIKRKSLFKIDRYLYALAGVYVVLGIIYAGFEKFIVNYRPIIMPDATEPEASFPSSHTLLICTIIITAAITLYRLLEGKKALQNAVIIISSAYTAVAVFGRLYCGVHWLTDIIASLLISASIIFFYYGASKNTDGKHTQNS